MLLLAGWMGFERRRRQRAHTAAGLVLANELGMPRTGEPVRMLSPRR
ncbi:hypothetical protein A7982_13664 [Minicystis rosea]|nr:hypothetical protein A7982_13664 [Minicystis rosea]